MKPPSPAGWPRRAIFEFAARAREPRRAAGSHTPIHRLAHKSVDNRVKTFSGARAAIAPPRYIFAATRGALAGGKINSRTAGDGEARRRRIFGRTLGIGSDHDDQDQADSRAAAAGAAADAVDARRMHGGLRGSLAP